MSILKIRSSVRSFIWDYLVNSGVISLFWLRLDLEIMNFLLRRRRGDQARGGGEGGLVRGDPGQGHGDQHGHQAG